VKIIAAIHWEALRLWLKRVRLVPRQGAADGSLATGKGNDYTSATLPARGRR
jgi:uncharacterized protein